MAGGRVEIRDVYIFANGEWHGIRSYPANCKSERGMTLAAHFVLETIQKFSRLLGSDGAATNVDHEEEGDRADEEVKHTSSLDV